MNQIITARLVFVESRNKFGWEDLTSGGISLKLVKMSEIDVLVADAGEMKCNNQGNSISIVFGEKVGKRRIAGRCGDMGEGSIHKFYGEITFSEEITHLRCP